MMARVHHIVAYCCDRVRRSWQPGLAFWPPLWIVRLRRGVSGMLHGFYLNGFYPPLRIIIPMVFIFRDLVAGIRILGLIKSRITLDSMFDCRLA